MFYMYISGARTEHFLHEFQFFARSPYDMIAYDQAALYNDAQPTVINDDQEPENDSSWNRQDDRPPGAPRRPGAEPTPHVSSEYNNAGAGTAQSTWDSPNIYQTSHPTNPDTAHTNTEHTQGKI